MGTLGHFRIKKLNQMPINQAAAQAVQQIQFRATDHLLLLRSELFSGLPADTLMLVLQQSVRKRAEGKEPLIRQSESNHQVYFILSGGVKVSSTAHDGKELISDVLGACDIFGEMSALHDRPAHTSIIALVPSIFMVMDKANFMGLISTHSEMAVRLLRMFAGRIERKDGFISDLIFGDAGSRLAKRLLAVATVPVYQGVNHDRLSTIPADRRNHQHQSIVIKISQQDLANMVGVSRESVNKQLRVWEREGMLTLSAGHIDIHSPDRLAVLALRRET